MAFITNWLIAFFCFIAWFSLRHEKDREMVRWWRLFYLCLGLSTFFGGLGHLFFQYTGIYGKIPCWSLGVVAGYGAGRAMLCFWKPGRTRNILIKALLLKSLFFWVLTMLTLKFLFVSIDAIVTYLVFCGAFAIILYDETHRAMRFFVIGVLVLLPSAFIFLLKLNPHRWFNKDDLSHILMLACIIFFFRGVKGLARTKIAARN